MSIKPSVVYIKGVHSTTSSDQTSDIGFPNIGLDKLFEGAILKEYTGDYDPSKKYVYKSTTSNVAIENEGHFNCIKNGYNSIADVDHYYILNGNNYIYNTADTSTWEGKWALSNAINGKDLYSIDSEADRVYIVDNYYEKNGNDYIKQDILTYNTYNNILQVSWDKSNKYIAKNEFSEDSNGDEIIITTWQTNSKVLAKTGQYLSIDKNIDSTYIIKLLNLTFNEGVLTDGTVNGTLYKLSNINFQSNESYYVKNSNNFKELKVNQGQCTFTTDPTTDNNFYIYQKGVDWSYPNTKEPEYPILARAGSIYNSSNFPLYTADVTVTKITKTPHTSYIIYEKTAVKVNYYYSNKASSLQFVFTDKDTDGVLEACNLPNDIGLEKYVHLTNLEYNK